MSVELRCEGCGKTLRAPREKSGMRSKCPSCGHELYIPTPEDEIEEFALAPEDAKGLEREAKLQRERLELDRSLSHDRDSAAGGEMSRPGDKGSASSGAGARSAGSGAGSGINVERSVLAFLSAMRNSDLGRADLAVTELQRDRAAALRQIDQLVADQIPPAQMADLQAAVYQGFLRKLRSQL